MNRRSLAYVAALAIALSILSIFVLDRPIALLVHQLGGEDSRFLQNGTTALELASGMTFSKFALGFVLILAGAALFAWRAKRQVAWILLFLGSTHLVARLTAGVLKEVFHRSRPFEVLPSGAWNHQFFTAHGSAFPSGHAAHFWALYFPLAFLFPRWRLPLLILPTFIVIARIGVNDHWLSDILGSIAIAALVTLLFVWIFRWNQDLSPQPTPSAQSITR